MRIKPKANLLFDAAVFAVFLVALFSGLVLGFVLTGGYQGGRNPNPATLHTFLTMTRLTWGHIHTWAGIGIGVLVYIHLVLHMPWVVCQVERLFRPRRWHSRPEACAENVVPAGRGAPAAGIQ